MGVGRLRNVNGFRDVLEYLAAADTQSAGKIMRKWDEAWDEAEVLMLVNLYVVVASLEAALMGSVWGGQRRLPFTRRAQVAAAA